MTADGQSHQLADNQLKCHLCRVWMVLAHDQLAEFCVMELCAPRACIMTQAQHATGHQGCLHEHPVQMNEMFQSFGTLHVCEPTGGQIGVCLAGAISLAGTPDHHL